MDESPMQYPDLAKLARRADFTLKDLHSKKVMPFRCWISRTWIRDGEYLCGYCAFRNMNSRCVGA
jgi:hypothetical protein